MATEGALLTEQTEKVNYQNLKDWIAAQEAYEAATGKPSPLTPAQRKAVNELSQTAVNPLAVNVEIGDTDYFGILNYFTTTKGTTAEYSDLTVAQKPAPLFASTITTSLAPGSAFPSAVTGGLVASSCPSFSRKKDARKYAAKCFVEWLVAAGHLTPCSPSSKEGPYGYAVSSPPNSGPRTKRAEVAGDVSSDEESEDDGPPFGAQLQDLCRRLGMGIPRYEMLQVSGKGGGIWSGSLDWGLNPDDVPEQVGRVDKVFGKKAARQQMAQDAVVYLREIEAQREAKFTKMMNY